MTGTAAVIGLSGLSIWTSGGGSCCTATERGERLGRIMSLVGDATLEVNMQPEAGDDAVEFLVARAGLSPTQEQMAGLKVAYRAVAAMAVSVRKPRGRMAEPVLTYSFGEEDLT
jgi:hypothetical protein